MYKEVERVIPEKDKDISCLKNHSQNLIAHISKLKMEKSQMKKLEELTSKK